MSAADGQQKTTATTTVTNKTTKTAAAPIVIIKEEKMDTPAAADATAAPPTMTTATAATTTNNKTVNNNNNNNTADSEQMADDLLLGGGDDDGQNEEDNCMADDSVLDMLTDADTAAISADVAAAAAAAASALAVNEDKETGAAAAVVVAEAAADGIEDIIIDEYVNEESDGGGGSSGGDADNTAGADKDQEVVDLGSDNEGDDGGGGRISVTTPGISGDDNELRTAGLKTSLMLSEEKNQKLEKKIKELEDELRRVYQHLINATEDKKKMDIKCRTLEEQLDRIVAGGGGGGDNGARHESRLQDRPDKKKMSPKSALFQSPAAKQSRPMNTNSEYGGNKKVGFAAGGGGNQPIGRQNYGQSFGDKFERRMPLSGNSGSGNYNNNNDNNSRRQLHPSAYKQPPHHRQQQQAPPPPPPQPSNTGAIGHQQITELSARLRIPDHVDRKAHELFEQFHTCPQIMDMCYKTRIRPSIAAAFISSRLTDYFGFSMRKLNEVVPTDRSALLECCAFIVDFLRINCSLLNASDLVKGFCKDLEIPPALEKAVNHVTKRAFAARSDWGRDPALVAAAATYLISQASHHKRPLTALAGVSGLAEANIGSAYLKMRVMVEQLVPPDFVFNTPIHMLPL